MKKYFFADRNKLHEMIDWLDHHLSNFSLSHKDLHALELVFEEALINIIHHSYKDNPQKKIDVEIIKTDNCIKIQIIDEGPAFDPTLVNIVINLNKTLEETKEGGLGIFFIKQYVDEMMYERKNNSNILTLIKNTSF